MCHLRRNESLLLTFSPTVMSWILKECLLPKWKGCRVLGLGPRKDRQKCWRKMRSYCGRRVYTPQTLVDTMNGLYFALRKGKEHRQLRSTPCQIEVIEKEGERPYLKYTVDTSKITQGDCMDEKWSRTWSFIMQIKTIQSAALWGCSSATLPSCQQTVQQMLLPAAFTPSNINMLVLCYTTGTLFTRQNHQLNMQGSRHWWLQKQPLSAYNCSHQARLYQSGMDEQLVMVRTGERSLKVFAVTKEPQTGTFWHPQLL